MKRLTLFLSFILFTNVTWSQIIKGKVVSEISNKPITGASLKLLFSNKSAATNIDGEFSLNLNGIYKIDTLLISNIGYLTLKIATNQLPRDGVFILMENLEQLNQVNISNTKRKFKMLSAFNYDNVQYTLQKDTARAFLSSKYILAKLFTADVDSFSLESIHLGRYLESMGGNILFDLGNVPPLEYPTRWFTYELKKYSKRTIFNLYIIYSDSTGCPLPLAQAIKVPVTLTTSYLNNEIKLDSYYIKPKQRQFYVAIEWLPILPNQNYSLGKRGHPRIYREFTLPVRQLEDDGSPDMAMVYELGYEPFVSIYNIPHTDVSRKFAWIAEKWIGIEEEESNKFAKEIALSVKISH